mgnify:CR=1 FL=1
MEFVLVDFKLVLYLDYKVKKIILLTNNKSHFFTPHPRQCCLPEVKHVEKRRFVRREFMLSEHKGGIYSVSLYIVIADCAEV